MSESIWGSLNGLGSSIWGGIERAGQWMSRPEVPANSPYGSEDLGMARQALLSQLGSNLLAASMGGQSFESRARFIAAAGEAPLAQTRTLTALGGLRQQGEQNRLQGEQIGLQRQQVESLIPYRDAQVRNLDSQIREREAWFNTPIVPVGGGGGGGGAAPRPQTLQNSQPGGMPSVEQMAATTAGPAPNVRYRPGSETLLAEREALLDGTPQQLAAASERRLVAAGNATFNPATTNSASDVPGWDANSPAPTGRVTPLAPNEAGAAVTAGFERTSASLTPAQQQLAQGPLNIPAAPAPRQSNMVTFGGVEMTREQAEMIRSLGPVAGRQALMQMMSREARVFPSEIITDNFGNRVEVQRGPQGNIVNQRIIQEAQPVFETFEQNGSRYQAVRPFPNGPIIRYERFIDGRPRAMTPDDAARLGLPPIQSQNPGDPRVIIGPGGQPQVFEPPRSSEERGRSSRTDAQQQIFARTSAERAVEASRAAEAATRALEPAIAQLEAEMASGRGVRTGPVTQLLIPVGQVASNLGFLTEEQSRRLSNTETFRALASRLAPQLRVEGSGATSNFDAVQLENAIFNMRNSTEGNLLISRIMLADVRWTAQTAQERAAWVAQNGSEAGFQPSRPLFPTVSSAAERDALPRGSVFIFQGLTDEQRRREPFYPFGFRR